MSWKEAKRPLIIISGPTAVGKTAVSVELSRRLSGECVSADSVQLYRGLDIGSAKAGEEERGGVPHHLIDVLDPSERCDAPRFQEMAEEAIDGIYHRGHLPILVGGAGFYIQALLYGIDFREERESEKERIRERLERESEGEEGRERLYERLRELDPESCRKIHPHNVKRLIRALEFFELHHLPISRHNEEERGRRAQYDALYFVLTREREKLYERIDERVDEMMKRGLLEEVKGLLLSGCRRSDPAMQGIGYRELSSFLSGERSLEEAVSEIKRNSRKYAKRQITWFRREKAAEWIEISKFGEEKGKITEWIIKRCTEHWG